MNTPDIPRTRSASPLACLALLLFAALAVPGGLAARAEGLPKDIPRDFFGMHVHNLPSLSPWPSAGFASLRLWDTRTEWSKLEPSPGDWQFDTLDRFVASALKQGVEPVMVLGQTPAWASARPNEDSAYGKGGAAPPADIAIWRAYVRTVGLRYKGRIRTYEIWNEPNLAQFCTGTPEELVILTREAHRILKEIDPGIRIVSPSPTEMRGVAWLDAFLANGGGKHVDIVGFHLYVMPRPPEDMLKLIDAVRKTLKRHGAQGLPLWNTESGWRIRNRIVPPGMHLKDYPDALPADAAAAYVARSHILQLAAGVERTYFYAWDNGYMGLTEPGGKLWKPAAMAYAETVRWLAGATLESCSADKDDTWLCTIRRPNGRRGRIIWNPDRNLTVKLPGDWAARQTTSLAGRTALLEGKDEVAIGSSPLLIED